MQPLSGVWQQRQAKLLQELVVLRRRVAEGFVDLQQLRMIRRQVDVGLRLGRADVAEDVQVEVVSWISFISTRRAYRSICLGRFLYVSMILAMCASVMGVLQPAAG